MTFHRLPRRLLAPGLGLLLILPTVRAQNKTAPAPALAPAPRPAAASAPAAAPATSSSNTLNQQSQRQNASSNSLESNTLLQVIDKAFNTDSDSINPEDGTMNWKGHSYSLGQMRVFRGRFERYLSLPPTSDETAYRKIIDQIFELLSARNAENAEANMQESWQLLYQAAEYEGDGGTSLGVANQVFNTWRIRDERAAQNVAELELERLRRKQQSDFVYGMNKDYKDFGNTSNALANAALLGTLMTGDDTAPDNSQVSGGTTNSNTGPSTGSTSVTANTTNGTIRANGNGARAGNNNNNRPTTPPVTSGAPGEQYVHARELAETELKIKSIQAQRILSVTEAKLQFQTQILSLFLQRRFQHCLIAASFYRFIFKGSQQEMEVGKRDIASFMPSSDMTFSVDTLEFLSRAAINDVQDGMKAVRSNYDDHHLMGALERLEETFFLGEFVPAVTQFERDKKQQLYAIYRKIDEGRKLLDLRDYDAVIKTTGEVGKLTDDFRSAEVIAAVNACERMSTLALRAAQQMSAAGDFDKAQEMIQKAAQLWPLNPAIKTYTDGLASQADLGSQAALFFDDAYKRADFRRIYERKGELAVALMNDDKRGPQLKEVIEKMSRIEIYLAQSQELLAQNNSFAAWEQLAAATPLAPDDVVVNQRKSQLAPRVADFVGKVDLATRAETDEKLAASLTHYLAAQDLYPASQLARNGIDRVTGLLLAQLAAEMPGNNGAGAPAPAHDATEPVATDKTDAK